MDITIKINYRAYRQRTTISKIDSSHLKLNENTAIIRGVYQECKRVHDILRYIIVVKNGKACIREKIELKIDKFDSTIEHYLPLIVLIIESPHRYEYDNDFNPIVPANGTTGNNIEKYLCDIINTNRDKLKLDDNCYGLVICNPVQFQASLFHLHCTPLNSKIYTGASAIRDKVWKYIFHHEKHTFIMRMKHYSPVLIINACTSKLMSSIGVELKKMGNKAKILNASKHPSAWSSSKIMLTPQ